LELTLYARAYCHLCEDMARALERLRPELRFCVVVRDVDADEALERLHGERVPVLVDAEGREICHYFLDEAALRRRLAVT
jgi:glutaredoxin